MNEEKHGADSKNFEGYKKLRLLCNDYIKSLPQDEDKNWVKREFLTMARNDIKSADPTKPLETINKEALQRYQDYLLRLPFTHLEMEENNKKGIAGIATWGLPQIEGRIICERLGIKLHVIEVYDDTTITKPAHQVVYEKSSITDENRVNYQDNKMMHIVVYRNHYMPLIRNAPSMSPSRLFSHSVPKNDNESSTPQQMSPMAAASATATVTRVM